MQINGIAEKFGHLITVSKLRNLLLLTTDGKLSNFESF
ncbi:hypothetical protein M595_2451 [Lyngbya aestuarii BL J]|uniref:Uncharacterized protein n=1 Tax=Lyngbya aestuarii BL J TaxID=1348334 RepID=U7QI29_9CYAN|nr:hypothetical protein M595_2451 [Lyngbya aestuarii BL J]